MIKNVIVLLVLCLPSVMNAQSSVPTSRFEYYRFYLKMPATELIELKYDSSGERADGYLHPDGKSVWIKNYRPDNRMFVKLRHADGTVSEFIQSPCYIDPVAGEL
jgi:hypothetical protein